MQIIVVCIVLFAVAASVSATSPGSYLNYCGPYGSAVCKGCHCDNCYEYHPGFNKCVEKPCKKDCNCGKCVCNAKTGFEECKCNDGFKGAECDQGDGTNQGPCKDAPCNKDGGTCVNVIKDGKCTYECQCNKCYEGPHCTQRKDCKDLDNCKCGTCKCDEHRGPYCDCDAGFTGPKCDQGENPSQKGPCAGAPCKNGGTCSTVIENNKCTFKCHCKNCYEGDHCNIRKDRSGGECEHFGCKCGDCKCNDCTGDLFCECKNGFKGTKCETSDDNAKGKCPGGWSTFGTKCFKFVNVIKSWDEARLDCNSRGGKLATIDNTAENNFASALTNNKNTWIGLNDKGGEGKYRWADTKRCPTFFNWYNGEPNNLGNEDCVHFFLREGNNKQWNDQPCTDKLSYVCELSTGQCKGSSCSAVGGTCTNDVATCGDKCECKECYKGPNCDQRKDKPNSDECKDLDCKCGTCKCDEHRGLYCDCDAGFTGTKCDQGENPSQQGPCAGAPCQNGGTCETVIENDKCTFKCHCKNCYEGDHCNIHVCAHKDCGYCGTCDCVNGSPKCICYARWWHGTGGLCNQGGPCSKKYHLCGSGFRCVPLAVEPYKYKCGYKCIPSYRKK